MSSDSGIYQIVNLVNNKRYIGSSVNIPKRWSKHRKSLFNNKHHSAHLQNSYNKYGISNFSFEIIELVENKEFLISREQYWLDFYQSYNFEHGYNICVCAGNTLGRKIGEEAKRKLRLSLSGENFYAAKLTWEKVKNIREEYLFSNLSIKQLEKKFNMTNIYNILNYDTWKIDDGLKPLIKAKMLYNRTNRFVSAETKKKMSENHYNSCGENNSRAKLNWNMVREIRFKYKSGHYSHLKLAEECKVSKRTITCILNNLTWKETT